MSRTGIPHSGPEYGAFLNARSRCTDPGNVQYKHYGGRGIEFRFLSFETFFQVLGPRPEGLTLDRIDNDGHYEPGNVRWATRSEQQRNRRPFQWHGGVPVITVFVRHKPECKYAGDETSKRCQCKKHLRWTANGKQYRRKTGARSWEEAEEIRDQLRDQMSGKAPAADVKPKLLLDAAALFVRDKAVQGITELGVQRYRAELRRFTAYCDGIGVYTVQGLNRELMTGYAETWTNATSTRAQARKMLRSFLRYCHEARWLDRIPQVPPIKVIEPPTLPLSEAEYDLIVETLDRMVEHPRLTLRGKTRPIDPNTHTRLRALIQIMRYSGLAIMDAVSLSFSDIRYDSEKALYRVVTARQKTGVPVSVPIPLSVAKEVLAVPPASPGRPFCAVASGRFSSQWWGSNVRALFEMAGIRSGHMVSHRLRDTFAVDLLQKSVPLEEVSKLLGHESIKTTEKHYSPWIKSRQDRLDSLVTGTW